MAGPPDMDPSALWLALTKMPRPHKLVDIPRNFPGTTTPIGQVAMWPLSQEEQMAVNAEADRFTKKLLQDPQKRDEANLGYQHTFSLEAAVQILSRACRDVTDLNRPAFPSPKQMRQHLTADEIGVMYQQYMTVQLELGPIVAFMSDDEMEGWIRRIAAGGSAFPFASLSWEAQQRLVLSMASRLASYLTDTSSAGLPPGEPPMSDAANVELSED
jgi:hypothetical protein